MWEDKKMKSIYRFFARWNIILIAVLWTIIILYSIFRETSQIDNEVYNIALQHARANFETNIRYRLWVTIHGGVYVPISDIVTPNPYQKVKNRDVETKNGLKLTLVNPAYMTRMVYELSKTDQATSHLTSLRPIRPGNKADEWERKALLLFENGLKEYHSIVNINNKKSFRFIAPFITEAGCLKCHAQQGYKVGDVRGGLTITIPYKRYDDLAAKHKRDELIFNFFNWLIGIIGLFIFAKFSTKQQNEIIKEKNRLVNVLEFLPSAVIIHWNEKIIYINNAARLLFNAPNNFDSSNLVLSEIIHPDNVQLFKDRMNRITKENVKLESIIMKIICYDGEVKTIETVTEPIEYEDKSAILTVAYDVTQTRLALQESIETKAKINAILKSIPDLIFILDKSGNFLEALYENPADLFMPENEFIGKNINQVMPEEIAKGATNCLNKLFETNELQSFDYYLSVKGKTEFFNARFTLLDSERALAIIRNDTDKKAAEEKERTRNEQFKIIFNSSPFAISLSSVNEGRYVEVNKAFEKISGFSKEEVIGKTSVELGIWFTDEERKNFIKKLIENQFVDKSEIKFRTRSGGKIICSVTSQLIKIDNERYILALIQDITDKKHLEYITAKEEKLSKILIELHENSFSMNEKELYDSTIDNAVKLSESKIGFFHKVDEANGEVILTTWNSEARAFCSASFNTHYPIRDAGNWVDAIRQKKVIIYNDYENSPNRKGLPEGHVPLTRFMSIPTFLNGEANLIFGVGNKEDDYTEFDAKNLETIANELTKILQKKHDDELIRKSENELRTLISSQSMYIIKTDMDGNYTFCNPNFVSTFGWLAEDGNFIGKNSLMTIYHEDHQICIDTVMKCIQNPEQVYQIELRKPQRNGKQMTTLWEFVCKLDENGTPKEIHCTGLDITEKKEAQKQIETQLLHTLALNQISDIIFSNDDENKILTETNTVISETLNCDRALIYNISFKDQLATAIC